MSAFIPLVAAQMAARMPIAASKLRVPVERAVRSAI